MSFGTRSSAMMALLLQAAIGTAFAQEQAPAAVALPEPQARTTRPALAALPAGTPVSIEISTPLASSTHTRGDTFPITLAAPLLLDGVEWLPAGTHGTGEIIHAAPARGGGAPGELLIAARTLETPEGPLPLRGFKLGATGGDNSGMAIGVALAVGPFAMFIRGREIVIPAGTRGIARTKALAAPAAPTAPETPVESGTVSATDSSPATHSDLPAAPQPDHPNQPKE